MNPRRTARRLAIDVLYEAEIQDLKPTEAFHKREAEGWVVAASDDPSETAREGGVLDYALALVEGVQEHHQELDGLIESYADRWALDRMPVVDRIVLRIALFELLWRDDVPVPVAINEAVELGKSLSTDDSGRFINGLLGRIVERERAR